MKKVLFISDPHYSINSRKYEEKWFPTICNFLEKIRWHSGVKKFLRFWDDITRHAFERILKKARDMEPYDLVIGLGDYTPGANEEGMLTEKTHIQYHVFKRRLNKIRCLKKLVWGDHDVGYKFNVSKNVGIKIGTEKGGISAKSVRIATELIGLPFGHFSVGKVNFIFISTNFIRNVDENSHETLRKLKFDQKNFLAKKLDGQEGKAFLLLHDPTALTKDTLIRKIIDSHREKIVAIIHGHLHAEFFRFIAKFSPTYGRLCKEYETILVPASWGMMGIGGGFIVMNIFDNGVCEIEKYKN
jgi:calcineurin-like phosphoesterase family protein